MKENAVLIALAYPEEFVAMIPGWYRKPLEWMGLVHNEMICMGHSALALVNKDSGKIEYADFGRYITPLGKGRARTEYTDPDCKFDIRAEIGPDGTIKNEKEIVAYIDANPHKTHGAGRLFASFSYNVNYKKAKSYILELNQKGSIDYCPFKENSSNCARFVFDTFRNGLISDKLRRKLIRGNRITPSPLGIVFYGNNQKKIYTSSKGQVELFNGPKIRTILKYFYTKPSNHDGSNSKKDLKATHQWLDGVGDFGWFKLDKPNGVYQMERRHSDGRQVFREEFHLQNPDFDIDKPFKLVHDCNALWCTVVQEEKTYKLYNKSYYEHFGNEQS